MKLKIILGIPRYMNRILLDLLILMIKRITIKINCKYSISRMKMMMLIEKITKITGRIIGEILTQI